MKKIITILTISILALNIFLVSCSKDSSKENNTEKSEVVQTSQSTKISQVEAKKIIDTEENIVILDVRTLEEYKEGHIKNSTLIPLDELESIIEDVIPDKKTKILVYCRSGNRSNTAVKKLATMGYINAFDFGGINDWDYEIEQ